MTSGLVDWRTSSYSGPQGNCVEVGAAAEVVGVRDTKDKGGGTLVFDRHAWTQFLHALKDSPRS